MKLPMREYVEVQEIQQDGTPKGGRTLIPYHGAATRLVEMTPFSVDIVKVMWSLDVAAASPNHPVDIHSEDMTFCLRIIFVRMTQCPGCAMPWQVGTTCRKCGHE